jgi:hypothetical protein
MMRKGTILVVGLTAALAMLLLGAMVAYAQDPGGGPNRGTPGPGYGPGGMMGGQGGMMGGQGQGGYYDYCLGMMHQRWQGMMGNHPMMRGMMNGQGMMGPGMMGQGPMMNGQGGMMAPGWTPPADLLPAQGEALSLEQAVSIAGAYIASFADDNLALSEVMQFDNHFYGEAHEKDTGRGAFEFLIYLDGSVIPEPGPNHMWNLKYGRFAGLAWGMAGAPDVSGDAMTVTPEQAAEYAQAFLDDLGSGLTVDEEAEVFYGYYTLEILENGRVTGMLSVNGFTGQVWLHHWHGDFIAMSEMDE